MDYKNKNIVIVGLGKTGLSCVDFFIKKGVLPQIMDSHPAPANQRLLPKNMKIHFGGLDQCCLLQADLIVVSPGVPLSAPALVAAAKRHIPILSDIELFCREIKEQQPEAKIVAITGSNGKTTVTSLIGAIASASHMVTAVGGNIGTPVLALLDKKAALYVLELSSFQLETTHSLGATIAAVLNISADHMDRYPHGMDQYAAAKQRIYQNAQYAIINMDDPRTVPDCSYDAEMVTYGRQQGKYALDEDYCHLRADGKNVLSTQEMRLAGRHNYLNALVSLAVADILGIDRKISIDAIKTFAGLPHRFELVYSNRGVRWINDSKGTNVGSTLAALESVTCHGTLYLLLGGDGKGADFTPLRTGLNRKDLVIYTFGKDAYFLAQLRPEISHQVRRLQEAIADLAPKLTANDVVLLSPACASWDQFKDYRERGEQFTRLAQEFGA